MVRRGLRFVYIRAKANAKAKKIKEQAEKIRKKSAIIKENSRFRFRVRSNINEPLGVIYGMIA